jgi:hopanoid biosynthesis associated RND transporter like protein HpnN
MREDRVGRGDGRIDELLTRGLVAWVEAVRRRARPVLVATALASVVLLGYAATHLGITTRHTALLADDLPFWEAYLEFAEVFPILDEALLVVVDAENPGRARDATTALADRLARQPDLFGSVYAPGGGEFFERHALLYLNVTELEDLSDQMASVQPILAEIARDRSLANLAVVLREGVDRARTDPELPVDMSVVFDSLSLAVRAVLEGRPRPISWAELLVERALPEESSRRLIILHPIYDYESLLPGRAAVRAVRATVAELGLDAEPGLRVRITGNVALNTEEMVLVARQAALGALATFVLVGGILFAALRSRRLVGAILVALLVGLVWTAAFAAFAVGTLNVVSVAFAILFIGLGVDFGIHLGMRYAELAHGGGDDGEVLVRACGSVGGSLLLCAFTTAMGFYVFVPTGYRAVGELGLISGTGMLISLFCTLTVLPALLALWPRSDRGHEWQQAPWVERTLIGIAVRQPRRVQAVAAVLALLSLLALPYARFDHNVINMRNASTESVQTFNDLLSESKTSPWSIDALAPDFESAVATAERLRGLDVVERAVTLADYVPEEQDEKLEILADIAMFVPAPPGDVPLEWAPLADQVEALRALEQSLRAPWLGSGDARRTESARRAADHLKRFLTRLESIEGKREQLESFEESLTGALPDQMRRLWRALEPDPVSLEDLPRDLVVRMLAPDGRARVQVLPSENLGDIDAFARFVEGVRVEAPRVTGSAVSLLEWGRTVSRSFRQALASAVVAIALLLWLLWRRLRDMALVLVPLLVAAGLTVATAVALGIRFNFANVLVLPLLLGMGVDSGIHLVHRHRSALGSDSAATAPELGLLGTSTARAVFFSALTTMGSFGSLALSTHPGIASLGRLLLIGVTFTLLCNLVLLPALIAGRAPSPRRSPE